MTVVDDAALTEVLSDFARTMVTDFSIQKILDRLVQRIVSVLPVTSAGVTLISVGSSPQYVAASDEAALRYERLQTELGEGPCLAAFRSGTTVQIADLSIDTRFPAFRAAALAAGLGAVFTIPLRHGGGRLGALDLYRGTAGRLVPEDLVAAQTLADVVAAYLINAQARENAQRVSEQYQYDAFHDPLTGLPNRALLLERIEHAGRRAQRTDTSTAVLFVDIDAFKSVNDAHGHHIGDQLLIAIAARLTTLVRAGDTLARFAGDEFVFLCEQLRVPADGEALAERVRATFEQPFLLGELSLIVSASVGCATVGPDGAVSDDLLVRADREMYVSKRAARIGAGFDLGAAEQADHRWRHGGTDLQLEQELRAALAADELELAYQPIVSLDDGRIVGVEALMRWCSRTRGPIPPGVAVDIAERSELIGELGRWVLRRACRDHARWCRQRPDLVLDLEVNVSPRQVADPELASDVAAILASAGMAPDQLVLELTETMPIADTEWTIATLTALARTGVRFALDDFGAGSSSLRYLDWLPISILKIDQHFVSRLTEPTSSLALVAGITSIGHDLGLVVVVEGVETGVQHEQVIAAGCDRAQGNRFGMPVTAAVVDGLLDDRSLGRSVATEG